MPCVLEPVPRYRLCAQDGEPDVTGVTPNVAMEVPSMASFGDCGAQAMEAWSTSPLRDGGGIMVTRAPLW